MPKVDVVPLSPPDTKPYDQPLSPSPPRQETKPPKGKPKGKNTSSTSTGRSSMWTQAEKLALFDAAMTKGTSQKSFEGQIEGRTAQQCYMTWQ